MSTTKIDVNTTNILKLLFFMKDLHLNTSNQIFTYRKLNLPITSSVNRPKYTRFLTLSVKKITHKPLKGSCKSSFLQCVCYCYNVLRWMFFNLCDSWKTLLFIKVYRCSAIFLSAMLLLSLKLVFWKKSLISAMTISKFKNKVVTNFTLVNSSNFFFTNEIFCYKWHFLYKQNLSGSMFFMTLFLYFHKSLE